MSLWRQSDAPALWQGRNLAERSELIELLNAAVAGRASDIHFQIDRPVLALVAGKLRSVTAWPLHKLHVERCLFWMTALPSVTARLLAGQDIDHAFNAPDPSRLDGFGHPAQNRFRFNATACEHDGGTGYQITLRHIPSHPPTLRDVGFPDALMEHMAPQQGAVLIAGPTGSGKTTTYAAMLRWIIEGNTPIAGNILTYEAPIEFLFGDIPSATCIVAQQEIGLHLVGGFAEGVRNSLRRNPALVVVGELRDAETIQAALEVANTGKPLYATVHANGAAQIPRRLALKFPQGEQHQALANILDTTRVMVSQVLVPAVAGGLTCLREWIILDDALRQAVLDAGPAGATAALRRALAAGGPRVFSMAESARAALAAGQITAETETLVLRRFEAMP